MHLYVCKGVVALAEYHCTKYMPYLFLTIQIRETMSKCQIISCRLQKTKLYGLKVLVLTGIESDGWTLTLRISIMWPDLVFILVTVNCIASDIFYCDVNI